MQLSIKIGEDVGTEDVQYHFEREERCMDDTPVGFVLAPVVGLTRSKEHLTVDRDGCKWLIGRILLQEQTDRGRELLVYWSKDHIPPEQ